MARLLFMGLVSIGLVPCVALLSTTVRSKFARPCYVVNVQSTTERRSDGARTHAAILDAAMRLASVEGINGLTIGRLAAELGVSKSGLYAHFGSKENLQRETIAAAREVIEREVMVPAMAADPGLTRLQATTEAFFSYVERRVFPGGCFFANLLAEVDAQPGPLHREIKADYDGWREFLVDVITEGKRRGELTRGTDPEQLAFEVDAALEYANFMYILRRDLDELNRGRAAIRDLIKRIRKV
jgi:AcrR family transcriptional regulator